MEAEMIDVPPQSKKLQKSSQPLQRITIKSPEHSYSHLKMTFDPPLDPPGMVDAITWRTTLTNSLMQYLGVVGSAIRIDILHIEGDEAVLRLPTTDVVKFGAAVSGFVGTSEGRSVGFKTLGDSAFLMGLIGRAKKEHTWNGFGN
ncbi:hypothetical protein L873DRAFT_1827027 [Choiromyces venosus 120613-1]|uniref:Ribonucleases P/MRP subunit Pop8-like domain-containing protein n=1 Tax=Choiromyces venosus 120613-1 TaxID=1336337 RepID=A0A3N4JUK8_9PEZI|nr:hypothetical protein L873DRAFT_1827027 [Choiromyces venosus 120613-1]